MIPVVIEQTAVENVPMIFSRLLKDRIIMLTGPVRDNIVTRYQQLLFLDAQRQHKIFTFMSIRLGALFQLVWQSLIP